MTESTPQVWTEAMASQLPQELATLTLESFRSHQYVESDPSRRESWILSAAERVALKIAKELWAPHKKRDDERTPQDLRDYVTNAARARWTALSKELNDQEGVGPKTPILAELHWRTSEPSRREIDRGRTQANPRFTYSAEPISIFIRFPDPKDDRSIASNISSVGFDSGFLSVSLEVTPEEIIAWAKDTKHRVQAAVAEQTGTQNVPVVFKGRHQTIS